MQCKRILTINARNSKSEIVIYFSQRQESSQKKVQDGKRDSNTKQGMWRFEICSKAFVKSGIKRSKIHENMITSGSKICLENTIKS